MGVIHDSVIDNVCISCRKPFEDNSAAPILLEGVDGVTIAAECWIHVPPEQRVWDADGLAKLLRRLQRKADKAIEVASNHRLEALTDYVPTLHETLILKDDDNHTKDFKECKNFLCNQIRIALWPDELPKLGPVVEPESGI